MGSRDSHHTASSDSLDDQSLLVVIATFNERDSLPQLVEQISEVCPRADVLVVDDQSPDGTGRWCDEQSQRRTRLFCLHRSGPRGLGAAMIDGIRWALERDYAFIATMDADLSHDPSELTPMLRMIGDASSATVIIGSRYVHGGSIIGWPRRRRVTSLMANALTRASLRLSARDTTSGFRVYTRSAFDLVQLDSIRSKGYFFLIELLAKLYHRGCRIEEHPICFTDRRFGRSKAGLGEGWRWLRSLAQLARETRKEFPRS